jgi:hypothetical protein
MQTFGVECDDWKWKILKDVRIGWVLKISRFLMMLLLIQLNVGQKTRSVWDDCCRCW